MGNLDPAVIQSSKSITLYNCGLTVIENMVFLVLKKWDMTVLLGSLFGCLVACLCFLLIGISVQKAMEKEPKRAQLYMQKTSMGRTLIMAASVFVAIKVSFINWVAVVVPLFFTRISISLIHLTKKKGE